MRRCCALLGIRDPALQCKLFDTLVLPILSYGCEVWCVDAKCGAAAEALHKGFMKSLLGVRKSVGTHMVLAELDRFPLQVQFWLRILRYRHSTIALDNARLVKLAMVDGFAIGQSAFKGSWQHFLGEFLHCHTGEQQLFHQFDVAFIVERAKHQHAFQNFTMTKYSTLKFYRTLQPVYKYADYLSTIRCVSNRRLGSRFRTGCHGLQVDTDRWVEGVDMDRGCLVCNSPGCVEDERHFIFDCAAYNVIRVMHMNLFQYCCIVADFLSL